MADDKAKTGLAAGAGGLVGAALAILATRKTAQAATPMGEVALDDATMLLLQAIAESSEASEGNTAETANAIAALAAALGVSVAENPDQIVCFRVNIPIAVGTAGNTPIQLPDYPIPFGIELVIKAIPANRGMIYVANSRAEAMNLNSSYWLLANEAIEYKIRRTGQLWVNTTRAGEGVICTVEQRRSGG